MCDCRWSVRWIAMMRRRKPFAAGFLALSLVFAATPRALPENGSETGFPVKLAGHGGPIMAVAVDPQRNRVLTASFDYSIILHELAAGEGGIVHRLIGHNAAVNDVAFVPGSDRAVSVSDDGSFAVWDLEQGSLIKRFTDTPDKVLDLAVSDDGRLAAVARWDGTARIFSLDDLRETARLEGHRGNVNAVAFSADARTLFTASYDGTIRAWDVAGAAEPRLVHDHGWGINVLVRHGGTLLFGGLDGTLARVDIATGESVEMVKSDRPVLSASLSADGARFAAGSGDGHIRVFKTDGWEPLEDHDTTYGPVWGLAFSDPEGGSLYHSGLDDFAILWQVSPRAPFDLPQGVYPRRFQLSADMSVGERQFQRKCSVCHTLDPDGRNRAGPTLYRLFGRKAGSLPGYPYSDGLRNSDIIWTEKTVGQLFDDGPDVVTPGSKMPIQRLKNIEDRDALIAFLKAATDPEKRNSEEGTGQ
jgi:cytochrome c